MFEKEENPSQKNPRHLQMHWELQTAESVWTVSGRVSHEPDTHVMLFSAGTVQAPHRGGTPVSITTLNLNAMTTDTSRSLGSRWRRWYGARFVLMTFQVKLRSPPTFRVQTLVSGVRKCVCVCVSAGHSAGWRSWREVEPVQSRHPHHHQAPPSAGSFWIFSRQLSTWMLLQLLWFHWFTQIIYQIIDSPDAFMQLLKQVIDLCCCQVDGEPCRLAPSVIHISLRNQANMVQKTKRRTSLPHLNE